jgi:two-component system, cell cycle sensor histidine kinase and response regulator CckA
VDVLDRAALFEKLFSQGVTGVFYMQLDEPLRWDDSVDREAALSYAFEHLRLVMVNDVVCAQLGLPREQLIGMVPSARWKQEQSLWRENMRKLYDRGHILHEVRSPRADGTWIWHEGEYVCTYDDAGRITGHVGTQRDLTDKRRLTERLARSERLAAVGTLAAGIGHEINNPLTHVTLNLDLLSRDVEAIADPVRRERMRERLAQAQYGAERIRTIVRDVQDLTRRPEHRASIVDINAVLERSLQIADHQLRHRARIERAFGRVPHVRGDEGRIVQLFVNLLVNAAQALPEGAANLHWIRATSSTTADERAVVEIADSGPGIPADAIGHVFEPFFTTKIAGEGTGLGLAICQGIVDDLRGEIDVSSEPGRGTTFRVVLPGVRGEVEPTPADAPVSTTVRPLKILVVDDEPQLGQLLRQLLEGHEVTAEASARTALTRLEHGETFDRIVCDLMMPDMTGMDFYDAVGAIAPTLQARFIFVSGGAFTERARSFLARVPNRRLAKPFDLGELVAALA